jgi:N-acetylmuramoyl-L-alanine amidase
VRDEALKQARSVMAGYDALVRRFHASGYADNALFNAGTVAEALFARFSRPADRMAALRYFGRVVAEYPASSRVKQARAKATALDAAAANTDAVAPVPAIRASTPAVSSSPSRATLTAIERAVMPEAVRLTLLLDREVSYHEEKLDGPSRLFFDLKDVQPIPELRDVVLRYNDDAVRQIRIGRHPDRRVRVVLDLEDVKKYSVFTLYNPFRLVIDCEPASARTLAAASGPAPSPATLAGSAERTAPPPVQSRPTQSPRRATVLRAAAVPSKPELAAGTVAAASATTIDKRSEPGLESPSVALTAPLGPELFGSDGPAPVVPVAPGPIPSPSPSAPVAPGKNSAGGFSLSRQLGLGVTRVVIDPGHGGHDPGAQAKGLSEAELTLDVALKLEQLLKEDGLQVVLTRRDNTYIPLEERTAIANRESADLFLSIHANASRNDLARGVETYVLSFASSPDAEAVAARENSASSGGMHNLPDIIKAIALNNKLDESRELAGMVQEALVSRLRRSNKNLRNLGVKKAPFVVLIGASMPSVLAEISFITNKQELQLLKTNAYKQRIAEALHASVMRYRRSLKGQVQVAEQE